MLHASLPGCPVHTNTTTPSIESILHYLESILFSRESRLYSLENTLFSLKSMACTHNYNNLLRTLYKIFYAKSLLDCFMQGNSMFNKTICISKSLVKGHAANEINEPCMGGAMRWCNEVVQGGGARRW